MFAELHYAFILKLLNTFRPIKTFNYRVILMRKCLKFFHCFIQKVVYYFTESFSLYENDFSYDSMNHDIIYDVVTNDLFNFIPHKTEKDKFYVNSCYF